MKFRLPLAGWILLAMFFGVVIGYVIFLTSLTRQLLPRLPGTFR